jgi:S-adenosylmethionine decarboxylase proenzyme
LNALGKHVLLELKNCDPERLNDLDYLKTMLMQAAREAGASVLDSSFHQFQPQGVSGVVVIAESHLFIHTWPEYGYAAADIFTCGNSVHWEKASKMLVERLGSSNHSVIEIRRGVLDIECS